jgi:hypothetical protein
MAPCDLCTAETRYGLRYSGYRLCPPCFDINFIMIIREERWNRDVRNGKIKATQEEYNKRFK